MIQFDSVLILIMTIVFWYTFFWRIRVFFFYCGHICLLRIFFKKKRKFVVESSGSVFNFGLVAGLVWLGAMYVRIGFD